MRSAGRIRTRAAARLSLLCVVVLAVPTTLILLLSVSAEAAEVVSAQLATGGVALTGGVVSVAVFADSGTTTLDDYHLLSLVRDGLDFANTDIGSPARANVHWQVWRAATGYNDTLDSVEARITAGIRLVVFVSPKLLDTALDAAARHPSTKFALLDADVNPAKVTIPDNVEVLRFAEDQAGFLAGYIAASASYATGVNKVAALGGFPYPFVRRYVNGFKSGARHFCIREGLGTCPITVVTDYVYDDAEAGEVALYLTQTLGADVLFMAGGAVVAQAGNDAAVAVPSLRLIGSDDDQFDGFFSVRSRAVAQARLMSSGVKKIATAIEELLGRVQNNQFVGGREVVLNVASDHIGFADCHTQCAVAAVNALFVPLNNVFDLLKAGELGTRVVPHSGLLELLELETNTWVNEDSDILAAPFGEQVNGRRFQSVVFMQEAPGKTIAVDQFVMFGGLRSENSTLERATDELWNYDFREREWRKRDPAGGVNGIVPSPRYGHTAVALRALPVSKPGQVLITCNATLANSTGPFEIVIGGETFQGQATNGTCTVTMNVRQGTGVEPDPRVMMVFGGLDEDGNCLSGNDKATLLQLRYSGAHDEWKPMTVVQGFVPSNRAFHSAAPVSGDSTGNQMLVYGGYSCLRGTTSRDLYLFTMGIDMHNAYSDSSWQLLGDIGAVTRGEVEWPLGSMHHSTVVIGDIMFLHGGERIRRVNGSMLAPGLLAETWAYNIRTGNWSRLADAPIARSRHAAARLRQCDQSTGVCKYVMYVHGGLVNLDTEDITDREFIYDPDTDTWGEHQVQRRESGCGARSGHTVLFVSVDEDDDASTTTATEGNATSGVKERLFLLGGVAFSPSDDICVTNFEIDYIIPPTGPVVKQDTFPDNPCADVVAFAEVRQSVKGFIAAFLLIGALIGLGLFLTQQSYLYNHWEKIQFSKVKLQRHETDMLGPDWLRMVQLWMEFVQIGGMILSSNYAFRYWDVAPDDNIRLGFSVYGYSLPETVPVGFRGLFGIWILNFDVIARWVGFNYNNPYWTSVTVMFCAAVFFSIVVGSIYTETEHRLLKYSCGRSVIKFITYIGPIFGNLLFIPIVVNLLGVFSCMHESAPFGATEFTGFNHRDCTIQCWGGSHNAAVLLSSIALATYVPFALYTAPIWQMFHDIVTIKDQPQYVIASINWKLLLCVVHVFFEQFALAHGVSMFVMTSVMLTLTIYWKPSTLEWFDLQQISTLALVWWFSISVLASMFIERNWAAAILCVGTGLIAAEFAYLYLAGPLDEPQGRYAKDTFKYNNAQRRKLHKKKADRKKLRFNLQHVARRDELLARGVDRREVERKMRRAMDLQKEKEKRAAMSRESSATHSLQAGAVYRDRVTGRTARVLGHASASSTSVDSGARVLGLSLKSAIPSQSMMSFQPGRGTKGGTLLIMRSPDSTLLNFLRLKINGFVAYHNAHNRPNLRALPSVEEMRNPDATKRRRRRRLATARTQRASTHALRDLAKSQSALLVAEGTKKRQYLSRMRGPAADIMPEEKKDEEEAGTHEFKPVNNRSLVAIMQNTGQSEEAFMNNRHHHAAALGEWISRNQANYSKIGSEMCRLFGIEAYRPVREKHVVGPRTRKLQKRMKEMKKEMEELRKSFKLQKKQRAEREYVRGKADGAAGKRGEGSK